MNGIRWREIVGDQDDRLVGLGLLTPSAAEVTQEVLLDVLDVAGAFAKVRRAIP